jgi:PAS domain S-box-containing protein
MENAKQFYEKMMDHMDICIFILDHKGKVVYANPNMIKTMGTTRKKFMSFNFREMYQKGLLERCISGMVYETKKEMTVINNGITESGEHYQIFGTTTPVMDKDGNITNLVCACVKVSAFTKSYLTALCNNQTSQIYTLNKISYPKGKKIFIGNNQTMRYLEEMAETVAKTDTTVLITGESGTGKEVFAHLIHNKSSRRDKEMIVINCAAIPESLLEAELFGYEKGSFTGALNNGKIGLIEAAEGNTLFLDEINSLPLSFQAKLLRVLEDKKVMRVGAVKANSVDFRLVVASNEELKECVSNKTFRADLYYRLSIVNLDIPPLRDRRDDIIALAEHFLKQYCEIYRKEKSFSRSSYQVLLEYSWPGNVRELKNFVERAVIMSPSMVIKVNSFPRNVFIDFENELSLAAKSDLQQEDQVYDYESDDFSFKSCVENFEKEILSDVLKKYGPQKAAEILKLDRSTITRKRTKYKI